ncbi:DUF421 domain-containing protein [Bacillus badius]|uniref:DUF421 domain-containing protein n=2 Tax=Bacillus badius TaxID=1455 RepID=A0ABR5AZ48_BACBA|nr:DUF421 domain-containing protein [Bacillus badius]KIL75026.1 hypothetical protein SD78_2095 [Bacillus badius]KIL79991.1 hypothetical protein SD77_2445 [Bacillus badius]MED4714947.1 DUF421 domain-containing protein [Bacillus badius]
MYLDITLKIVVGLVTLLLVIRLLGKKELSQMTPFDLIYLILLGSFLEEAMFDQKISILQVLYAVALWGMLIYFIEKMVMKSEWLKKLLKGEASDLVVNGKVSIRELKKNHMEMEQLRTLLRSQGYFSLHDVEQATLETNGTLSVLPKAEGAPVTPAMLNITASENQPTYLLIDEGKVDGDELKRAGKSKEWLRSELKKEGVVCADSIFYAEWSGNKGFYIVPYKE